MKNLLWITGLCLLVSTLSSCATIITGTLPTSFSANSTPAGAKVTAKGLQNGEELTGTTPATLSLNRASDYELTFEYEGYESQVVIVRRTINGWFWGNIIVGGVPGWIIDFATNAMWVHQLTVANIDFTTQTQGQNGEFTVQATVQYYDDEGNPYIARVPVTFYPKS